MAAQTHFKIRKENHIAWLTMSRPEKRNTMGAAFFRELALTGRDFSAEEALNMGLITRICDDHQRLNLIARELADQIAACPPMTVQGTKEVILYNRDHGLDAGLGYVAQKNAAVLPSADLVEAVTAFMEKRKPNFKGK